MPPEDDPTTLLEAATADAEAAQQTPEPEEVTPEPEAPEAPETPETPETPSRAIIEKLSSQGFKWVADKYKDDDAAIAGIAETAQMVGKRNEDADRWRDFARFVQGSPERLEAAQRLLSGQPLSPPPEKPAATEPPPTMDQWRYLESRVETDKATPEERAQFSRLQEDFRKRLFDVAYRPQEVLGSFQEQAAAKAQEAIQAQLRQQNDQAMINQYDQQHAARLYNNGDPNQGFSAYGQLFQQHYLHAQDKMGIPSVAERLHYAQAQTENLILRHYVESQQKQTTPVPTQAVHKPDIAVAPGKGLSKEDYDKLTFVQAALYDQGDPGWRTAQ